MSKIIFKLVSSTDSVQTYMCMLTDASSIIVQDWSTGQENDGRTSRVFEVAELPKVKVIAWLSDAEFEEHGENITLSMEREPVFLATRYDVVFDSIISHGPEEHWVCHIEDRQKGHVVVNFDAFTTGRHRYGLQAVSEGKAIYILNMYMSVEEMVKWSQLISADFKTLVFGKD